MLFSGTWIGKTIETRFRLYVFFSPFSVRGKAETSDKLNLIKTDK